MVACKLFALSQNKLCNVFYDFSKAMQIQLLLTVTFVLIIRNYALFSIPYFYAVYYFVRQGERFAEFILE